MSSHTRRPPGRPPDRPAAPSIARPPGGAVDRPVPRPETDCVL